jgi:hypothetical protein
MTLDSLLIVRNVIMPNGIMPNGIMPNIIMPNDINYVEYHSGKCRGTILSEFLSFLRQFLIFNRVNIGASSFRQLGILSNFQKDHIGQIYTSPCPLRAQFCVD